MAFIRSLTKFGTDENKAIYSNVMQMCPSVWNIIKSLKIL